MLRNIFLFYLLLITPMALMMLGAKTGYIQAGTFTVLLLSYALLYHPLLCGLRLIHSHKIDWSSFWKNFVPFWNEKYRTFLFLNK